MSRTSRSSGTSLTAAAGATSAELKAIATGEQPPGKRKSQHYNPKLGPAYVHSVLDDHSRVVYSEIHNDETAVTAEWGRSAASRWSELMRRNSPPEPPNRVRAA